MVESYKGDPHCERIIYELTLQPNTPGHYCYGNEMLRYKGRLYVGQTGPIGENILDQMHNSVLGGHSDIQNTYRRVKQHFFWQGLKRDVEEWVKRCNVCAQNKVDGTPYTRLLQSLPIPHRIWEGVSMDFIESLPKSERRDTIMVVVDRLTKYAHFISLKHPFSASDVAKAFMGTIYKLTGLPRVLFLIETRYL